MKHKLKLTATLFFCSTFFLCSPTIAEDIPINITGEVFLTSCQVNNGKVIEVDFGDISVTDVSNARNQKTIAIPVSCDYSQGTAYVKVTGSQLGSYTNVLASNVTNFGIALYQGEGTSTKLVLGNGLGNTTTSIGYPITNGLSGTDTGVFVITAVPFKDGSSQLEAKAFSASASISITYY